MEVIHILRDYISSWNFCDSAGVFFSIFQIQNTQVNSFIIYKNI